MRPRRARLVLQPGDAGTRAEVGGKGFRLQELARLGLRVPPYVVLTTVGTDAILAPVRRDIATLARCVDRGDLAAGTAVAERIVRFIRTAPWPPPVRDECARAARTLAVDGGLAVRSSAVGEDGADASWAGVFASRLGVTPDALETAVRDCLAAAFADRVARYRGERGLRGAWPRLAVVIQEMVQPRVAGIAFTADPRSGDPRLIVVAGYGVGAGVVGDLVDADWFERGPADGQWTSTVRRKEHRALPDGSADVVLGSVAPEDQDRPTLSVTELDQLASLLQRIERAFTGPQDVEWALDTAGAWHVLQARPIGTLPGALGIWDDSNIGESYPGVTLPLTYSLVRRTYERLFTRALAQIGVPDDVRAVLRPDLRHLIGIIRGHLYMNLLAYYRLFAAAPGIGWTVSKWEDALGIRDAPDPATARPAAHGSLHRRAARAVGVWWRLARRLRGLDAEVERFRAGVADMLARYDGQDLTRWPFERLLTCFESLMGEFLDDWTILIFNDLFAFLFSDQLARLCRAAPDDAASDLHQRLLADLGGVASVRPLRGLRDLADQARRIPEVAWLLWSELPAREVWERLGSLDAASGFRSGAARYVAQYGDRAVEELKLETVPLSEQPWSLVDLLRSLTARDGQVRERDGSDGRVGAAAERQFRARWARRPFRRWYALWVLRRARWSVAAREDLSYARARAYGLLRRLVRAMGVALVREGVLAAAEDVNYVTFEDLEAHARAGLPGDRLDALVAVRKEAYRRYRSEQPPHRIVRRGSVYRAPARTPPSPAAGAAAPLAGIPCSAGRARGVARVVHDGASPEAVRDRILVARVAEPAWVFLMSVARGVVVERGSILSHAAIIGRELGVPTIVGVAGATAAIRDGDEVEMDGGTGEVRVLHRAGASCG